MNSFEVSRRASEEGGEFVLGVADTGTHACYMIYGVLGPGEGGRLIKPGKGHEELVIAVKGDIAVTGRHDGVLKEGTAFHVAGDEECYLRNDSSSEALYVAAGGHSGGAH